MTPGQGKTKKLTAQESALGYFYARLSNAPEGASGGNPGAGHSFKDGNTHNDIPCAPLSSPRKAGRCSSRFHHMAIIASGATPKFYFWVSLP